MSSERLSFSSSVRLAVVRTGLSLHLHLLRMRWMIVSDSVLTLSQSREKALTSTVLQYCTVLYGTVETSAVCTVRTTLYRLTDSNYKQLQIDCESVKKKCHAGFTKSFFPSEMSVVSRPSPPCLTDSLTLRRIVDDKNSRTGLVYNFYLLKKFEVKNDNFILVPY